MLVYLQLALIVISITLIGLVLMQTKGTGLGSIFGGDGGVYQTRRGVERTLFNMTVLVSTLFLVVSLLTVIAPSG